MKRAVILYLSFAIAVWGLNLRVAYIMNSGYSEAAANNNTRVITVAESRGYIYDRNYYPLVNGETVHKAAVIPYDGIEEELYGNTSAEDIELVKKGKPCVITVDFKRPDTDNIKYFDTVNRYSGGKLASHIIGYTDAENKTGIAGMEKSFDSLLGENSGSFRVRWQTDAKGCVLPNSQIEIIDENYNLKGGVKLTVDNTLQKICTEAAEEYLLEKGAVIVADVKTSEILAAVSIPEYEPNNIAQSLNDPLLPFLTRYLTAYSVGSVFKPVTAAAALESGISEDYEYECSGSINIGGIIFNCHKHDGHGKLNMSGAMAASCNTYFISLAMQTGGEKIKSLAEAMGIGEEIFLTDLIFSDSGKVPSEAELYNAGGVANLAFGQGSLSATPLHMAAIYACIANKGIYTKPYILMQQLNTNGDSFAEYIPEAGTRVMSEETANILNKLLINTVENGSGKSAKPDKKTAAGKTATAQTGIYENGNEVLRTWFCGYYPAENPEYVIVVLKENGDSPITDCTPIFKAVAEKY